MDTFFVYGYSWCTKFKFQVILYAIQEVKREEDMSKELMPKKLHKYIWIFGICISLFVFFFWQNNALVTSLYIFESDRIGEAVDGYRIVQISDLHNKRFGREQNRLLENIKLCEPDMIVVTGDLVDSNHTNLGAAMEFIHGAVSIAPVYYVTGNHEKWLDEGTEAELLKQLKEEGVTCLDDEKEEIKTGQDSFLLLGLDDAHLMDDTLGLLVSDKAGLPSAEDTFTVLLAHEPQNLLQYSNAGMDLVLSGHAHGGQVRLPFVGGIVAPDQGFFPEYTAGLYEKNGTSMIVSRGLGNSIIPVRIFNRPEIVCVELRKK